MSTTYASPGRISLLIVALLVVACTATADTPTYAERLGWPADARVVIFHNDDAGMCHEANIASIQGVEEGLITSWSVMMPCSWVPEINEYLKANPEVCSGLHLTLTCEWDKYRWRPVAGPEQVPGLLDEDGYMWGSVRQVAENATPDEFETEIRAQIALAERMGMPVSHLDTHMGTVFATEEFIQRYITVGMEKQIPVLIPGGHMKLLRQESDAELLEHVDAIRMLAEMVWASGLPVLDDLHASAYDWKTEDKTERFIALLRELGPGVTQIIIHATTRTDNFDEISGSGITRQGDLNAMLDPKLKEFIEEEGIILTSWRELMERRKRAEN